MGSSRHRGNSNSANAARSVQKSSKLRSKPTKLRTAADALRAIKSRRPRPAKPPYISPTVAVREMRDGVPVTALRYIRKHLELIQSTTVVVANALREQNAGFDIDAADVLRSHVTDELQEQIEGINSLLGGDAS